MTRVLALALAAALALGATPATAQQAELDHVLDTLAALWARGDAAAFTEYLAAAGAELDLGGQAMSALTGRKFTGALRRAFQGTETVSVVAGRASRVAGAEDRAYGELDWRFRRHGATRTEASTVFFGLAHGPRGWRVTQIRILR